MHPKTRGSSLKEDQMFGKNLDKISSGLLNPKTIEGILFMTYADVSTTSP